MKKRDSILKKTRSSAFWVKVFPRFLFGTLVVSIIFVIYKIITAESATPDVPYDHVRSDYVLMLLQCSFGLAVMFLPSMLERRFGVSVPNNMYLVFLYAAIYLGEVRSFYYIVPRWDTILHAFSGAMLGTLGFSLVYLMNDSKRVHVEISPAFVAIFAFFFAVSMGAVWEIYEFTMDGILGLNMQKFATEEGVMLIGRAALRDTMKDIVVDIIGAGIACLAGYLSLKRKNGWLDRYALRRVGNKTDEVSSDE